MGWPGQPITAHWGVPDPAAVDGTEAECILVYRNVFGMLERRIRLLVALPIASLGRIALTRRVEDIGRIGPNANKDTAP